MASDVPTESPAPRSPGLVTAVMQASLMKRLFDEPVSAVALDRFRILRVVGEGAIGTVYEAYDPRLDRRLALKLLRSGLPVAAQEVLLAEARALAQVSHEAVVTVFDAGIVEDRVFIAMEILDGGSLSDWLAGASGPPPVREILQAFVQAGRGLSAAHAVGIVHRDFKPANVLRARDGRIKVGDFGLARALSVAHGVDPSAVATRSDGDDALVTSQIAGTPAYMAPEALEGRIDPRSDQFSFCVALWEALFGERPPAGTSALVKPVEPPERAADPGVPRRIVAALVRGLSVDPGARWPSMDALLGVLERRRATRVGATTAAIGLVALVGTAWALGRAAPPCEPSGEELAGAWDDEVRARGEAAFERLKLPYADATWEGVSATLDRWATDWDAVRRETCEASVVRHERSAEAHDLASACLHAHREALAAFAAVLTDADPTVVERAAEAAAELPEPADCADPDTLRTWGLLPPDPDTRAAVAELRRDLAAVNARLELGRPTEAATAMPALVERARALSVSHVLAEALGLQARAAQAAGESQAARDAYAEALKEAARAGDDHFAAELWPRLVFVVGDALGKPEEAVAYELPARVAMARIGDDPRRVAELEHALGSAYRAGDDLPTAEAHHRAGLRIRREHMPDEPLLIAESLNRLAGVRAHQREAADAVALLEQVLARYGERLPPEHPRIGSIEFNLGQALSVAGRMEDAVEHLRRAVAIKRASIGVKHPRTVNALAMLGTVLGQIGKIDEGLAATNEAIAALADRPDHPQLPIILNNLGGLYYQADRIEDAARAHERAIEVLRARGDERSAVFAMNLSNLALMQTALTQHEEAEANFLAAIEVYEEVYGPEHPLLWRPNAMLARLYRTTERADQALPFAARAVKLLEGATSDPNEIADAELELAQVRWDTGLRDAGTIALAERARDRWREIDLDDHADTAQEWLATHTARAAADVDG